MVAADRMSFMELVVLYPLVAPSASITRLLRKFNFPRRNCGVGNRLAAMLVIG